MVEVQTDNLIEFHEILAQVRIIHGVLTTETTILLAPSKHQYCFLGLCRDLRAVTKRLRASRRIGEGIQT